MEALTNMMSLIDVNSESIPEGDYLKLCNFIMDVHKALPKKKVVPPPFQPVIIPQDLRDRCHQVCLDMGRINHDIRRTRNSMKALNIRHRVTEGVRRNAIRDAANRMGLMIRSLTIESLREKGVVIPDTRIFYKEYMERVNIDNQTLLNDLQEKLNEQLHEYDLVNLEFRNIDQEIESFRAAH